LWAGLPSSRRIVQIGVACYAIIGAQGVAFAASEMDVCSPPTKGIAKVDKGFTMPMDMSWDSEDKAHIFTDMNSSDSPEIVPTSRQGGLPGDTNFILETYQFYFPSEGVALSDKDKNILKASLSNSSYILNYVLIRSYTDKTGSSEVNEKVSIGRADAVRSVAIEHGVAPEMICAEIIADRWNEEDEKARGNEAESDRRVEVYVYFNRWQS
jgi:outer membrane protein OmpA-like peptidoglycan-associated protein